MQNPIVFSYLRFSDPKQATGSSAERQAAYARKWAADKGMILDESLTMRDEGLSAYHQRHVKHGALGAFLAAVDEGMIPRGSVLIVEGLDRLSRAEPIQAQAQLAQIIGAGITVVTASDGKEYNRERLKAQPMDLVYSLLVMIRAHEESDTKSKRVKASIRRQCEAWVAGNRTGRIRNGGEPDWVKWDGERWHFVEEHAHAMREAVRLFLAGYGASRIVQHMNDHGLRMTKIGNIESYIYRAMRLRPLIGQKVLTIDGEQFILDGYYPPLIDLDTFNQLQAAASGRRRLHGKSLVTGVITGIGITYCGYCGASMSAQNWRSKVKPDGSIPKAFRRIVCNDYRTKAVNASRGSKHCGTISVANIESAIMRFCSDQMNLASINAVGGSLSPIQAELDRARLMASDTEAKLARITEAILAGSGAAPATFARKATELEGELAAARQKIASCEHELGAARATLHESDCEAWRAIREAAEALDETARMTARKLVADTFSRISIYPRGERPGISKTLDVVLVGRRGASRIIRIDKQTGDLVSADDFSQVA